MVDTYRNLGDPVDQRTPVLELPLPHQLNDSLDDVGRIRTAFGLIDTAVQLLIERTEGMPQQGDVTALASAIGVLGQQLQGLGASALKSVNGLSGAENEGAITLTAARVGALAVGQYGFGAEALPQLANGANLNEVEARSMWFMGSALVNAPAGNAGWFLFQQLVHNASWRTQTAYGMAGLDGCVWMRQMTNGVWGAWVQMALNGGPAVNMAGGAMNCALGDYFYDTVNGARTLFFTNVPAGPYSCVAELLHISGTITPPVGCVWADGKVPTFATNKRHLIYFQRAMTGTGGWIMSSLPGSAQ